MEEPSAAAAAGGDSKPSEDTYDLLPYSDFFFFYTHPDVLATVATMLGMQPAQVTRCRVLEMGCAHGGNLVPMADQFPESQFLGIDLSARQIEGARARIERRGMCNIAFRQQDLLNFDDDTQFDYIICHGVFSWVPRAVQEKILQICARNLAPHGVAYISYNTNPGWRMRGILRDVMVHHARDAAGPQATVVKAREILKLLGSSFSQFKSSHSEYLRGEIERLEKASDEYLFHDHLEAFNTPSYFHEFAAMAASHNLQYMSESDPRDGLGLEFDDTVRANLRQLTSRVEREQFLDYLRNSTFRRSLVCRADVVLKQQAEIADFERLYFTTGLRPESTAAVDLSPGVMVRFKSPSNTAMNTNQSLVKATMLVLSEAAPGYVGFKDLLQRSLQRIGGTQQASDPSVYAGKLTEVALDAYLHNAIEVRARASDFAATMPQFPAVRKLARDRAAKGAAYVLNLKHERVLIDSLQRRLVTLLDGSRDRAALSRNFLQRVLDEKLKLKHEGNLVTSDSLPGLLDEVVTKTLDMLLEHAALLG